MPLSDREIARRTADAVEIRTEPLRLRFRLIDLPCADAHLIRILFNCTVQALDKPIERGAFAETFLSTRASVTADDLVEHFHPALKLAASRITPTASAEQWLNETTKDQLLQAIRQAADPLEFDSGLKLLPPFDVVVESDSLHRERMEQMQRKVAERRAAGQLEHVQRSADLLKQFQTLQASAPQLSAGAILERLSASDRGDMLEALLAAAPGQKSATLWAVAGQDLLRIDLTKNPVKADRIPLGTAPFRSVQADQLDGKNILLLGSRSHVMLYETDNPTHRTFEDPTINSPLGFNRALVHNARIWATHGEAGVRAWDADGKLKISIATASLPAPTFQRPSSRMSSSPQTIASIGGQGAPTTGPRNLAVVDDSRLLFSIGNRIATIDSRAGDIAPLPLDVPADVLAILPDRDRILIVYENGTLSALDRQSLDLLSQQHRPARLNAADLLPWMGETRVLLAHEDGSIDCIGLEDSITTEYRSPYRDIRALAATSTTIAAITADRSRIALWHSWDGTKPYAEIHASALTRHRAADLCFCNSRS
jgi:hypothetical protein